MSEPAACFHKGMEQQQCFGRVLLPDQPLPLQGKPSSPKWPWCSTAAGYHQLVAAHGEATAREAPLHFSLQLGETN